MQFNIFSGIFDSELVSTISPLKFLLCLFISLAVGVFLAFIYSYKNKTSKSFLATLAILPAVVCIVILMVNGNIGTGVAVAGAFSLVRFRSAPGTAREISAIFIAMSVGLIFGMGYLGYGVLFAVIISVFILIYNHFISSRDKNNLCDKIVTVTIPEDLNYTEVFTDIMEKYTTRHTMTKVKTTNMGSLFKITYELTYKDANKEKDFIDEIRCRNGNLEITVSPLSTVSSEL